MQLKILIVYYTDCILDRSNLRLFLTFPRLSKRFYSNVLTINFLKKRLDFLKKTSHNRIHVIFYICKGLPIRQSRMNFNSELVANTFRKWTESKVKRLLDSSALIDTCNTDLYEIIYITLLCPGTERKGTERQDPFFIYF